MQRLLDAACNCGYVVCSHDKPPPDLLRPHGLTARAAAEQADLSPNVLLACTTLFSKLMTPCCCLDKCHQLCKSRLLSFPAMNQLVRVSQHNSRSSLRCLENSGVQPSQAERLISATTFWNMSAIRTMSLHGKEHLSRIRLHVRLHVQGSRPEQ